MSSRQEHFDVVIVGGGVTGGSSACFLSGHADFNGRIAVIERDSSYHNAPSAKATGGFRQQFSTPENIHMGLYGAHFVKNAAEYLSVDGETPDLGFKEHGYLLLATTETLATMQSNNDTQRAAGADTRMHDAHALGERFPWLNTDGLAGGCLGYENEGWLDPYALLQAYKRKARASGVTYVEDEVVDVVTEGDRVQGVKLRSGTEVGCETLINTAGASGLRNVARMVGLELPIESRKRSTFVFNCREDIGVTPLTILPEGCAFRPEGANFIVNLAPSQENDPDTDDTQPDHYMFEEQIWPILAVRVPAFEAVKAQGVWCCHYDVNRLDENLIIDRHPRLDNFLFAGGFSGHGLQQSPAVGRALSELVVEGGYMTLDLSRFGYQRILDGDGIHEKNCF